MCSARRRHINPDIYAIIMAILLNIISTGSRKSAGAATFRRVRGRTIMSQKRGSSNKSLETRAATGLVRTYREAVFYIMSAFADGMQNSINESFEPTMYGSRRNAFFKLNYSAVELALNGSPLGLALLDQIMHNVSFTGVSVKIGAADFEFTNFNTAGWTSLTQAANVAGTSGTYTRSTIGGRQVLAFNADWDQVEDPSTATVTGFVLNVTTGPIGQRIASVTIQGVNIPATVTYNVRVGSPNSPALKGTWAGSKFTPSGEDAATEYTNTHTIYITDNNRVLYSRDVQFYSQGAGGE